MPTAEPRAEGAAAILHAATALFAREGYEPVSVADIAAAAGVSKANVFYHFASKEALYLAVMRQASDEHAEYAEALLAERESCAGRLRRLMSFELRTMLENETRTLLIMRECGEFERNRARLLARKVFDRNYRAVVALFEQGRRSGEFARELDASAAALVWYGAKNVYFQWRNTLGDGQIPPDEYAAAVCRLVLRGALAPRARACARTRSIHR